MTAENHSEYTEERDKLSATISLIDTQIHSLHSRIRPTDNFAEQAVNAIRASTAARLEKARNSPYFGRVRFEPSNRQQVEDAYVGKVGVYDETTLDPVVIDWRSPVASLFYSSNGDESSFIADGRRVTGRLTLKRSYKIDQGQLKNVYDHNSATMADEFLVQVLSEKKDVKMTDIVATIQQEQNQIIRAARDKTIIVQGVAGSGKTSVALHRLAFLLYEFQDILKPSHVAIIAPNRMFIGYIADVLPELGVDGVQQTTLEELLTDLIGDHVAVRSDSQYASAPWIGRVKGTIAYKEWIESWIASFESVALPAAHEEVFEQQYPFQNQSVTVRILVTSAEWQQLYERTYRSMPIVPRLQAIQKHIASQLQSSVVQTLHKQKMDVSRTELNRIAADTLQFAQQLMPIESIDIYESFRRIFANEDAMQQSFSDWLTTDHVRQLCLHNRQLADRREFEPADLPALLLLSDRLFGHVKKRMFDHLVVDEAQDISPFAFSILRQMATHQSMTVLGDIAQAIYPDRGFDQWSEVVGPVFTPTKTEYYRLAQSYRSTIQIMELANVILRHFKRFDQALPMVRTGDSPHIEELTTMESVSRQIATATKQAREAGYKTIAIITRFESDCSAWHPLLIAAGVDDLVRPKPDETELPHGTLLMSVSMAKGLEFDVVIIADASEYLYGTDEQSGKLLYVAVTRALHRLFVYSVGRITPLLRSNGEGKS